MENLIETIRKAGGHCMLVGGAVIDKLQGRDPKDWDIEVYGLPYDVLSGVLAQNGYKVNLVGQAFGIIKTKADDLDIDLSLPRRDNKNGVGHKGFSVDVDADLTPKQAAARRDLTINSMFQDMHTGEIVDHFGGKADLEKGCLRATDNKAFSEDPLRVLRIMQLLPRKGAFVDPGTVSLCQSIVGEFGDLAAERVFEEFRKLLMKAERPSMGLQFLADCGWLQHFPELANLVDCHENPEWHPEGTTWEHTKLVVDQAAKLRDQLPEEWRLAFMFGMLLHDVGKASVMTSDGVAHGHDKAGEPLAAAFMNRLKAPKRLVEQVVLVVGNHMRLGQLDRSEASLAAFRRLHLVLPLNVAAFVSKADFFGKFGTEGNHHSPSEKALQVLEEVENTVTPLLKGRHLLAAGLRPGPEVGCRLRRAFEHQLETGSQDLDELLSVALEGK